MGSNSRLAPIRGGRLLPSQVPLSLFHGPFFLDLLAYTRATMSGLEVVSAIASIGQLIDLGIKVINRMNEFRDKSIRLPKAFRHIQIELPVFINILRETKATSDANQLSDSGRKALKTLIRECYVQIHTLNTLLTKALPKSSDSGTIRSWKAVTSFRYDDDVKEVETVIRKYLQTLSHQGIASARKKDALRMSTALGSNISYEVTCTGAAQC
jgi:hypothetical protein